MRNWRSKSSYFWLSLGIRSILALVVCLSIGIASPSHASGPSDGASSEVVLKNWYGLILKLIRHTPTYSPPVASRALAYLGVTAYEAVASGSP